MLVDGRLRIHIRSVSRTNNDESGTLTISLSHYKIVIYFLGLVVRGRIRNDLDSRVRIRNPSFSGPKNKKMLFNNYTVRTVQQESGTLAGAGGLGPGNLAAQSV